MTEFLFLLPFLLMTVCSTVSLELLTKKQVAGLTKLSTRSIDRKIEEGSFPRGLTLGRARRWRTKEIEEYLDGLAEK